VDPSGLDPVIRVTYPDGRTWIPYAQVKNGAQAKAFGKAVGKYVPIFVPDLSNPWQGDFEGNIQEFFDKFSEPPFRNNDCPDELQFANFWKPHGSHDYKYENVKFDAFGNFAYGVSGRKAGFTGKQLQDTAQLIKFGKNDPVNVKDIQLGINAANNGVKFDVVDDSTTNWKSW
jgi:hypothetical protein